MQKILWRRHGLLRKTILDMRAIQMDTKDCPFTLIRLINKHMSNDQWYFQVSMLHFLFITFLKCLPLPPSPILNTYPPRPIFTTLLVFRNFREFDWILKYCWSGWTSASSHQWDIGTRAAVSIDWVTGCKQARCALTRCEKAIAKRVLSGQGVPQSKFIPTYLYVENRRYYDGDESGAITVMMMVIRRTAYLPRWSTCRDDDDDRLASQQ